MLCAATVATIAAVSLRGIAGVQDAPPPEVAKKAEAFAHFDKGVALYDAGDWSAALAEFLEARRLYPSRNAQYQAGLCLVKLHRYDEALERFEGVLRDYAATMPPDVKETVERKVAEMRGLVGDLVVEGAEPGAAIAVDGVPRGELPLPVPIRVSAGDHGVRVVKEGFEPFEARVVVAGGAAERVDARLRPLAPRAAPAGQAVASTPPTSATARPPTGQLIAGIVVGSVGLASIGVASAFGVMAIQKKNDSAAYCLPGDHCYDPGLRLRAEGLVDGNVSTALFIAGGAALVAGGVLIAVAARAPRASVQLTAGPRGAAIWGTF